MRAVAAAGTDIGRVRDGNEDSYLFDAPLFAVADGMGGHRGGEVASSLAVETIGQLFDRGEGSLLEQVRTANRTVFERSVRDPDVMGMGTTLTAVLLEDDRARLAHVGDSRAYLLREGELRLLTEDHTMVHRMVVEGELSAEEAETHPYRSILTRVLGVDPDVVVDEDVIDLRRDDRLLLCSDGLTGMLSEDRIALILDDERDPRAAVDRLIRESNAAGGVDNITAIVIDLVEGDEPARGGAGGAEITGRASEDLAGPDAAGTIVRADRAQPASDGRREPPRPARPQPVGARWPRAAVWIGVTLGVLVLVLVGLRVYLDSQWYVGISRGRVALYRGVPTSVGGFDLHHVVEETEIPAERAEALMLYRDLSDGITADDRPAAEAIVEQIRTDVVQASRTTPSPNVPTASPTPSDPGSG